MALTVLVSQQPSGYWLGCLGPDSGSAYVCGFDVQRQPREAKACLGYLPEDAVPFLNLTVRENLEYMAVLRGLSDSVVDETIKTAWP